MQRAAHEPPTENRIDGGDAKGQKAGFVTNPRDPLQAQKTLPKLLDHDTQAFEEAKVLARLPGRSYFCVLGLF
ncbi:MAG TPA: hypothetical protein VEJ43_00675 [Pseudolabrys sp.]|nr:hypothetical protein [Pseudolabrys sp.]